eukprot:COSAG01_NODE_5986_length_3918_cov_3.255564_3_plen_242_part_00
MAAVQFAANARRLPAGGGRPSTVPAPLQDARQLQAGIRGLVRGSRHRSSPGRGFAQRPWPPGRSLHPCLVDLVEVCADAGRRGRRQGEELASHRAYLSVLERQLLEAGVPKPPLRSGRPIGAAVGSSFVSRSFACIGSPCLRHCVHGASIGGSSAGAGGAARSGRGGGARGVGSGGAGQLQRARAGAAARAGVEPPGSRGARRLRKQKVVGNARWLASPQRLFHCVLALSVRSVSWWVGDA